MSILAVGTLAFDSVESPFGRRADVLGGSATFLGTSASYFESVALVAAVGEDFPQEHLDFFTSRGMDTRGIQRLAGKTFRWRGRYDYDLNVRHTLETCLNVLEGFQPTLPAGYEDRRFVLLGNLDPTVQIHVLDQVRAPEFVVADTMNFWISSDPDNLKKVIERTDVLILNDDEGRQLTGKLNVTDILSDIQAMGPETVVLKKGEHGALLALDEEYFAVPGYPLQRVVDPTGAGDTFAAGFAAWLHRTGDKSPEAMKTAAVYGSALASFCCEDFSTRRLQEISLDEIEERVESFRKLVHFN